LKLEDARAFKELMKEKEILDKDQPVGTKY